MTVLGFLSNFEWVQGILALGLGAALVAFAVGYNVRKSQDRVAEVAERKEAISEKEHVRAIEMHNVKNAGLIEGRQEADD